MDDTGERRALVLLDEAPIADVLEPPVGDGGCDLLHGVEAEVAAVGEDRSQQRADLAGVDPLSPGCWKWTLNPRSFSTSMSRSASRIVRLRASSQGCSSARRSDCAGSGGSAGSVFSRHPSSSNATCRLSATPSRKRSNASESRPFKRSTAAPGSNGGTLEHAQRIAGHASPKTTKLYDRTADTISLDEIERIVI